MSYLFGIARSGYNFYLRPLIQKSLYSFQHFSAGSFSCQSKLDQLMMKITAQYQLFKKAPRFFEGSRKTTCKRTFNPYWAFVMAAGGAVASFFYRKNAFAAEEATKTKPLKDHPLKNLVKKIEEKRVVLINPTTGEKQDFGSYFQGYGKGFVKGANLRFQHKVTTEGSHVTELHFRINEIYKERVLKHLDILYNLSPEEAGQFAASLKGKKFTVETELIFGSRGVLPNLKIQPKSFHVEDVGDLFLNPGSDLVKVSLKGEQDVEGFHQFLKAFKLEEALTMSTPQDLEKMKLKFLFKFFYPPEADKLKKEEAFFQLSPEDLKQKIIEIAPEMKKHFETYQIQKTEILPGFARYSIPIDKEVRALGGRALTAGLMYDDWKYSGSLTPDRLDRIANIVKHGMLSIRMRRMASINKDGLNTSETYGADNSIFAQMVWQGDVDKQKNLKKFGYASDVRLYFSLKALNRGSYQYDTDLNGMKIEPYYSKRKNILDFTFDSEAAKDNHEVMIPGRILPEEIRAVNVKTQEMREQLVAHFKKHDIIQISAEGKETVHGIPLDDFILVEKSISPKTVENCSDV